MDRPEIEKLIDLRIDEKIHSHVLSKHVDRTRKAPCTRQEIIDYAKSLGFTINIVDFWNSWEQKEWQYVTGGRLRPLKNWKSYVTRACNKGWHGATRIPPPRKDVFKEKIKYLTPAQKKDIGDRVEKLAEKMTIDKGISKSAAYSLMRKNKILDS